MYLWSDAGGPELEARSSAWMGCLGGTFRALWLSSPTLALGVSLVTDFCLPFSPYVHHSQLWFQFVVCMF